MSLVIKVGISSCLVGEKVRYDGGHKRSDFCDVELRRHLQLVPYCPEVGIGLGVPRPTIRLQGDSHAPDAVIVKTAESVTERLADFASNRERQFEQLSGYILCAKSPSCGMERVRVYKEGSNENTRDGMGIFARRVQQMFPAMPLEEDGRLNDPLLRENFILRVYVYSAWQQLPRPLTASVLQGFHAQQKFTLLAHNQPVYRELGRKLAEQRSFDEDFTTWYIETLMDALSKPASRKNHTNVLQHIQGFFSDQMDADERQDLTEVILGYNSGQLPLVAPLTLINHYLRKHPDTYLQEQSYLHPYPDDLKLRYGL
ncbi:hypothetical protein CWE12_01390 [Aliidiomarina sedimenti]|uniref:DUF1722 domain-containing protein n=1 Tax=Aliidiomarina sedimenti TaxID=1933879 RepID=A0ABY0C211_9GAMM|nr:DUF523 and DUF1722 domain-containing protein [Aliidiomarina sedimenti]RUO31678.1 hypothetical protein CWE12_01390 [Aliidiomarina sedimenti]